MSGLRSWTVGLGPRFWACEDAKAWGLLLSDHTGLVDATSRTQNLDCSNSAAMLT